MTSTSLRTVPSARGKYLFGSFYIILPEKLKKALGTAIKTVSSELYKFKYNVG